MLSGSEERALDEIARRLQLDDRRLGRRVLLVGTAVATAITMLGVLAAMLTFDLGAVGVCMLVATASWVAFVMVRRPARPRPP